MNDFTLLTSPTRSSDADRRKPKSHRADLGSRTLEIGRTPSSVGAPILADLRACFVANALVRRAPARRSMRSPARRSQHVRSEAKERPSPVLPRLPGLWEYERKGCFGRGMARRLSRASRHASGRPPQSTDASVRPDADRRRTVSLVAGAVALGGACGGVAPGPGGSVAVVVDGLEVVVVEVARDGRAELDALKVGGPEVDAGPDASVDVLFQRV